MDVPAATRVLRAPLGHEARHDAEALADLLRAGLEEDRAIGRLQRFAERDGRLVDAGAGLGVQAFDGHAEGRHLVHQRVEEQPVVGHAQQRVAEHAGGQVGRAHALLLGPAVRRLEEVEPLEFQPAHRLQAELLGTLEHALQGLPRADRVGAAVGGDEVAEEERHRPTAHGARCRGRCARARRGSRAASR